MGFKDEGVKRESLWFDGKWWDQVDLGMLEDEYRERMENKAPRRTDKMVVRKMRPDEGRSMIS